MFPNTSVASDVVKATLFEYYFWYFFILLIIISTAKDIIGVKTKINRVNFQLISHKNTRLPKNCNKFLNSIDKLSEQTE
jgi:hypothetical protein